MTRLTRLQFGRGVRRASERSWDLTIGGDASWLDDLAA